MNCEPGDLAIVVNARSTPELNGRIVLVRRAIQLGEKLNGIKVVDYPGYNNSPTWVVEACGSPLPWVGGLYKMRAVADRCLRPIRNPGEDAQDETLQWLPVPSRDEVPA